MEFANNILKLQENLENLTLVWIEYSQKFKALTNKSFKNSLRKYLINKLIQIQMTQKENIFHKKTYKRKQRNQIVGSTQKASRTITIQVLVMSLKIGVMRGVILINTRLLILEVILAVI